MRTRYLLLCVGLAALFYACDRTNTVVESVDPGPTTCAQCHDPSNLITGKETEWAESVHGTGVAYLRGTSKDCAGCHSGHAFAQRVKAGLDPTEVTAGDPDPTRQDCRACHQIHQTYTEADFALQTTKPVKLYAITKSATFDGGMGNLCANCHQPRTDAPVPVNGVVKGINSHWGPHHGPQSAMILGVGGAGVTGKASGHYGAVGNTCVQCHMGDGRDHHFDPAVATCQKCHPTATNFDVDGVQTEIAGLLDAVEAELINRGVLAPPIRGWRPDSGSHPGPDGRSLCALELHLRGARG